MATTKSISQLDALAGSLPLEALIEVAMLSTTVTMTEVTISAAAADNSYNDSASGFVAAGFEVGNRVKVTGFTGNVVNNLFAAFITSLTTAKMTIGGADGDVIVDDTEGESVTITKWDTFRADILDVSDAMVRSPSIQSVVSAATVTPTFSNDMVTITAQAVGLTLGNWTGTPIPCWSLGVRIFDDGNAQTIAYDTQYRAMGVILPLTTVVGKTIYLGIIYNEVDDMFDIVSVNEE